MDPLTVGIGALAIGYGLYTAWARKTKPGQFSKLEAMKRAYGDTAGMAIHVVAYTVVPVVAGAVFLYQGLNGVSLF